MADDPTYRAVLGYHRAGDFFYFTMFGGGNRIHADTEQYHDLRSFAGLATAVHEHACGLFCQAIGRASIQAAGVAIVRRTEQKDAASSF